MGISKRGPWGALGASTAGPSGEEGAQDALWTKQARLVLCLQTKLLPPALGPGVGPPSGP